jgi:hypothetical protein
MAKLQKLEGAVVERKNPHLEVLRNPSPSVNFVYGNGWGLPFGYTAIISGPPKGGKSVLCNTYIAQLHRDYPDAIAVKYNTEMREEAQLTEKAARAYGIDWDRYQPYDVNEPALIFDAIRDHIGAMCDEGAPIKLVVIDSVTGIQGRNAMNAESVMNQQMADVAKTTKDGLKLILPTQRKHKFAVLLTAHQTAIFDPNEVRRTGKTNKMSAGNGVQHFAEYFLWAEPNRSKEGRADLLGHEFVDETKTDMMDKSERTGHKIRVRMDESSMGPAGRVGEFTMSYDHGIINQHEEVFQLGVRRGVIRHPNNLRYEIGDKYWTGKEATLSALQADPELQQTVLKELRRIDLEGDTSAPEVREVEES